VNYTEEVADGIILGDVPGVRPGTLFHNRQELLRSEATQSVNVLASRLADRQSFSRAATWMMRIWAMSLFTLGKGDVILLLADRSPINDS
jgi:hypothetical protein